MVDRTPAAGSGRRAALAHLGLKPQPEEGNSNLLRLSERPHIGKLNLRGDPRDSGFLDAVAAVLGFPVPVDPNATRTGAAATALALGPDEWLLTTPPGGEAALAAALEPALRGRHAALTDVTDAATILCVAGPRARPVLAEGCPLDLHPRAFRPGQAKQTLIARAEVILHRLDRDHPAGGPVFEIHVRRSEAEYLWLWLTDAATEYGVAVEA